MDKRPETSASSGDRHRPDRTERIDRTEKLISLTYALLSTRVGYTREQLRRMVRDYQDLSDEAFERKFERDKQSLRALGLRLVDGRGDAVQEQDRGPDHRYRLLASDYRLPPLDLTPQEAAVLGMATQVVAGGGIGTQTARAAERLGVRELDAPGVFLPVIDTGTEHLEPLLRHLAQGTAVRFGYRTAQGASSQRTVMPWGLGHRAGHWYLAAGDTSRDDERMFRLDRIEGSVVQAHVKADAHVPEAYGRPDRFSMSAALDRLERSLPSYRAELLAAPGRGGSMAGRAAERRTGGAQDVLWVDYSDVQQLAAEAAGEGAAIVAPTEAAEALISRLRGAAAAQAATGPEYTLQRHSGGRPSAEVTVARALDLVCYVVEQGGARRTDLMERFGLNEKQLDAELTRLSLCGVPDGLHDELLDVEWDGDEVHISNASVLAEPMNLNLLEAAGILLGLDALASAPEGTLGESARSTVHTLAERLRGLRPELADFEQIVAVRAAARDSGTLVAQLAKAIEEHHPVALQYAGGSSPSTTERVVEPVRMLETDGHSYLQAWCRLRGGPRSFRLDRIVSARTTDEVLTPDPERTAAVLAADLRPGPDALEVEVVWRGAWQQAAAAYAPERTAKLDGALVTSLRAHGWDALVSLVARSGGAVTVAAPEQAVAAVLAGVHERLDAATTALAHAESEQWHSDDEGLTKEDER